MSNSGKVWDIREAYKQQRNNAWSRGDTAICAGGDTPSISAVTDTIQISTTGNAIDFGDLSTTSSNGGAVGSSVRGVVAGGYVGGSPDNINTIQYINFQTKGNFADFGDETTARRALSGSGNNVRGLFAGGYNAPANLNTIDFVTIASLGNATDFKIEQKQEILQEPLLLRQDL